MRVAVSLCLVSGWLRSLVRPSLKTCGRRGVLLRRPPELLQKHRVGSGRWGGVIHENYISKKEKKKCNGFESAVVSPAAGSEREKEIEIDWVWGWRRRAKIRCAGPVLLLRGSPRSQFSKQTVCLCAS